MDQPYSRIADALLDYQYWSPRDPQQNVYDDTGWTFGELGNVQVVRVTDAKVLDAAMDRVNGEVRSAGGVTRQRFDLPRESQRRQQSDYAALSFAAELRSTQRKNPLKPAGKKFNRGSFIIRNASADEVNTGNF